jgi:membrane-bound lytic murein transglycosylase D
MKRLITIMVLLLLVPDARAAGTNLLKELTDSSSSVAGGMAVPQLPGKGAERVKVADLPRNNRFQAMMELPHSEIFTIEPDETPLDEFELKLPDEELPESDIPLTVNEKVQYFIGYFQTSARKVFARWLSRSERYLPMMKEVLKKEGLPEDLVYLAMIESGFTPHATSVASAVGPWQFMSGTGKRYSLRIDQWIDERRDPLKSTVAAALYLKELYALFNNDWYLAAAGYNAGENKILRAINMYSTRDFWTMSKGSYLKRETKDYVPKLLAAAIIAKDPAKYGFADVAYLPPIEFDTVTITTPTDLELVAKLCEVPLQTIKDLNPELRRWCTPPGYPDYQLKLPYGKKARFEEAFAKVPDTERLTKKVTQVRHKVGKRETLESVARRYSTTVDAIKEANRLKKGQKIAGKRLTIPVAIVTEHSEEQKPVDVARADKEFFKYYTVKKGDTLASLSRKFSVSAKLLATWNKLKGKMALRPGKRIIVAKYVEKKGELVSDS